MTETYLDKLKEATKKTGSIVCMGLDPVIEAMPAKFKVKGIGGFPLFLLEVFEEMQKQNLSPGAFKPNQGFYVCHDKPRLEMFDGSRTLVKVMDIVQEQFPNVPIVLDSKRGDIAKSSKNYAIESFDCWEADAVTASPYMGRDSVMPLIEHAVKKSSGVYLLDRTSNKGAVDLQNLVVETDDPIHGGSARSPLYMKVAEKIVEWARGNPGVGAVVGATSLDELTDLARFYAGRNICLLIPGVGSQGGEAGETVKILRGSYDLNIVRINSSSGLTHPWASGKDPKPAPNDYAKSCVEAFYKLNAEINQAAA